MAKASLADVFRFLQRACALEGTCDLTDRQLLEAFLIRRDEGAFTFLVRRHGPVLFGACRRLLGNSHDAEDALQAAFLVLVSRTRSIRRKESVGSWLYGVAQRIARRTRTQTAARQRREWQAATMPKAQSSDILDTQELRAILDEEIGTLPEKYRAPIILHHLEGKSLDQAAHELGCLKTTLAKRVERARELLRKKLERRGITLAVAALATTLTEMTAAPLPGTLTISTVKAATLVAGGKAVVGGCLSAHVLALMNEALRGMVWVKAKMVLAVAAIGLAAGGAGWVGYKEFAAPVQLGFGAMAQRPGQKKVAEVPNKDEKVIAKDQFEDPLPTGASARMGTVRWRLNRHAVHSVAYTPDGKYLLVASIYNAVELWDARTGQFVREVVPENPARLGTDKIILCTAFSADGRTIASGDFDGSVRTTEVATGKVWPFPAGHTGSIRSASLSADGKVLATSASDKMVRIWDTATGRQIQQLTLPDSALSKPQYFSRVALAPDGKTFAWIASKDYSIHVCDVTTGVERHRLIGHENTLQQIVFSPDGRMLASTGNLSPVRLWDVVTGQSIRDFTGGKRRDWVYVVFSPDGKRLAAAGYEAPVQVWEVGTGKMLAEIPRHPQSVGGIAFAPEGKTLVVTPGQFDPTIYRYDLTTGTQHVDAGAHSGRVSKVAFSPNGKSMVSIGEDMTLRTWESATGKELRSISAPKGSPLFFSPDAQICVMRAPENFSLVHTSTGRELWQMSAPGYLSAAAMSPDNKMLATWTDNKITLWDVASGRQLRSFAGHHDSQQQLAFSSDGQTLVGLGNRGDEEKGENSACFWNVGTGRLRRCLKIPFYFKPEMALSPDGKMLAMCDPDGKTVNLWESATGGKRLHLGHPSYMNALQFSPDGSKLVTASLEDPYGAQGGPFRVWDARTGLLVGEHKGHRGPVRALTFSKDGRWLATASTDTTILLWPAAALAPKSAPRAIALTAAEVQTLWDDLASADAAKAYQAMGALIAAPRQSLPFIAERLKDAVPREVNQTERIARLIADLDSAVFAVRTKATTALAELGDVAEPALLQVLKDNPTLETRQRAEGLLKKLETAILSPKELQALRALEVLEYIGSPAARAVLEALSQGAPGARETEEAKASLDRLARRPN
jgi:RNA polymerase sigma factor (sigma-70 family)